MVSVGLAEEAVVLEESRTLQITPRAVSLLAECFVRITATLEKIKLNEFELSAVSQLSDK